MAPCPRAPLTFGDSSGNPARTKKAHEDSSHYIAVTATMDMQEAQRVDAQAQKLKAKYFEGINPERASFHAHQLLNKLFRHTGSKLLARQQIKGAFDDIVKIAQNMNATINVVIIDKCCPDENYRSSNTVVATWTQASRTIYQDLLNFPPNTTCAIMLDRYDYATNRIVSSVMNKTLQPLADPCNPTSRAPTPRPIFVDSMSCNTVQLVDMFASVVAKNNTATTKMFRDWHADLKPTTSRTVRINAA